MTEIRVRKYETIIRCTDIVITDTGDLMTGFPMLVDVLKTEFECPHCYERFNQLSALQVHMNACTSSNQENGD